MSPNRLPQAECQTALELAWKEKGEETSKMRAQRQTTGYGRIFEDLGGYRQSDRAIRLFYGVASSNAIQKLKNIFKEI